MTNVWCPFISTITTCLAWCGWENILFWLVGTPQRQTRPNSNPSAGCCPPLNQQRLFDQQPPACAGSATAGCNQVWLFLPYNPDQLVTNDWKYMLWDTSTPATSASFHLQGRRSTSSPPGELGQLYLGSRGWWMDGEYLFFVSISRSEKSWIYPDTVILEKQTFLWNKPTRLGWHSFVQSGAVKHRHLRDFLLQLGVGLLHLATATAGWDMEFLKDAPKSWAKAGLTREYSRTTVAKCSNIKILCL